MIYVDGYEDIVTSAFEQIPDADVIVFNLIKKGLRIYAYPAYIAELNPENFGDCCVYRMLYDVRRNTI